jgi:hypothetical protein
MIPEKQVSLYLNHEKSEFLSNADWRDFWTQSNLTKAGFDEVNHGKCTELISFS